MKEVCAFHHSQKAEKAIREPLSTPEPAPAGTEPASAGTPSCASRGGRHCPCRARPLGHDLWPSSSLLDMGTSQGMRRAGRQSARLCRHRRLPCSSSAAQSRFGGHQKTTRRAPEISCFPRGPRSPMSGRSDTSTSSKEVLN